MRYSFLLCFVAGCASQSSPAQTFDPCAETVVTAAGASADQLASLDAAIAMWRTEGVGAARGDGGAISLVFRPGAAAVYGFYDDATATILVNDELTDPAQRAITIAHELGHAFALVHVPPGVRASVMNPGNVTVAPDDGDRAALAAVWGGCPAP